MEKRGVRGRAEAQRAEPSSKKQKKGDLIKLKEVDVKLKAASAAELKSFVLETFAVARATGGPSVQDFKRHLYPLCPADMKLSVASVKEALKTKPEVMVALCRDLFTLHALLFNDSFAGERPIVAVSATRRGEARCAALQRRD